MLCECFVCFSKEYEDDKSPRPVCDGVMEVDRRGVLKPKKKKKRSRKKVSDCRMRLALNDPFQGKLQKCKVGDTGTYKSFLDLFLSLFLRPVKKRFLFL